MKQTLKPLTLAAALGMAITLTSPAAQAATYFSIDAASPSVGLFGILPGSILTPGPIGGPPTVFLPAAALGLLPGDELDALAFPALTGFAAPTHGSVDRLSVGIPGLPPDVASEAAAGQAAGDIFASAGLGTNSLATNQDALGLLPPIPAGVPNGPPPVPIDNLDALEYAPAGFPIVPGPLGLHFSLAVGSPTLLATGFSAADILFWSGVGLPPGLFLAGGALGLVPGDDLDALVYLGVMPAFSLAPGSPSLLPTLLNPAGFSAADILGPGVVPVVLAPAGALGLAPGDNVDAMAAVPEPETYAMMLAGLGLLGVMTRLRRRG